MSAALKKLHVVAFGDLRWIEQRTLQQEPAAFEELLQGRSSAPKIVLRP